MKYIFIILSAIFIHATANAQKSDFIVIKKKNNRTLKTYFPGSYIAAQTASGFQVSGTIQAIKNDSLFIQQMDVHQVPTQFGTPVLDTIRYSIAMHYREISRFFVEKSSPRGRSGPSMLLPKLLQFGGIGYNVLELVNTAYRKESLSENNKLAGMGIAAGVAAAGFVWQYAKNQQTKPGKKLKIHYIDMTSPDNTPRQ